MKKFLRIVLPLLLVCGIAAFFYHRFHDNNSRTDILKLYGNVDIRQVRLAFQANGRIRDIPVQEGDAVKAGDLIGSLDPVRYKAAASQARAQVAAQKEVLARLVAGSRPEEIREARARVKAAEASVKDAELIYGRNRELVLAKTAPQQNLDSAEAALDLARAELEQAREVLALAVKGPREEDIEVARAQLLAYEATRELREQELSDTNLLAPDDGVIQDRVLEPGDMASPQATVVTLALTDPVWVRAYVPEPDLGKIAPGMEAEVTTDSFPGKVYEGWIGYISPTSEFTPKQIETPDLRTRLVYQARIYVCNPQNELRLGMPASVTIPLDGAKDRTTPHGPNPCGREG